MGRAGVMVFSPGGSCIFAGCPWPCQGMDSSVWRQRLGGEDEGVEEVRSPLSRR